MGVQGLGSRGIRKREASILAHPERRLGHSRAGRHPVPEVTGKTSHQQDPTGPGALHTCPSAPGCNVRVQVLQQHWGRGRDSAHLTGLGALSWRTTLRSLGQWEPCY